MPRLMASIGDLHSSDARFLFATWKELDWQLRSDTEHWAITPIRATAISSIMRSVWPPFARPVTRLLTLNGKR